MQLDFGINTQGWLGVYTMGEWKKEFSIYICNYSCYLNHFSKTSMYPLFPSQMDVCYERAWEVGGDNA